MTEIIILHPKCNPKKVIKKCIKNNFGWFCFNEDFIKIRKWEHALSNISNRLVIAEDMESIYDDVYKKYSDFMADIGLKYNEIYPEWWLSPVSEKNGWPPRIVVNECIIKYFQKIYDRDDDCNTILITSSISNLNDIKKMALSNNLKYTIHGHRYYLYELISSYFSYILEFLYFGLDFINNYFLLKVYCRKNRGIENIYQDKLIIFRTYCHDSSFKDDGSYININFGDIKTRLEEKGFQVIYQPNMSSISDKKKIYKWFSKKSKDDFWLLEKHLSISDLVKAYFHILKQFIIHHKMGYNIFLNLEKFTILNTGRNYLKSLVPIKLKQQKIEPSYIISDWENKAYEKYMCTLFNKVMPKSKVVGYFGGIPFPTSPVVNLTSKEAKTTPLPDKTVCCSQYAYDWLEYVGFEKTKLIVGPSFRQDHVFNDNTTSDDFILVALPLNYDLSFELISEVVLFARRNEKSNILLKSHPFLDISKIMGANKPIPENISISNENISNLFQKCKYFVYTGPTTTACEAFVLGKEVCRYISNNHFSLDCLHFKFNDLIFNFTNYIELEEHIIEDHRTKDFKMGVQYKEYIFNKMDANYVDIFLS